jgi:hypothetical protein
MIVNVDPVVSVNVCSPVFLALEIWREAQGASVEAKLGVGYSIMNRVERPSWWGRRLDQVMFKKWQYSSMAAPGDPNLIKWPMFDDPSWLECLAVARAVLGKTEPNTIPGADSYHDSSIPTPPTMATGRDCGVIVSPYGNSIHFWDVDHDYEAPVTGHS